MQTTMEHIDELLRELKSQPLESLRQLPEMQQSDVRLAKGAHTIAVWRDALEDGSVRVVVQGYKPWILGMGSMTAKGFVVSAQTGIRDLNPEELWDFT